MAVPSIKTSFASGEVSPSLYGRLDLSKWHSACSVARNFFVSYKGGLLSRAGLAFVGICLQPASANSIPPRNIEFTFNIFQSYVLEFGELYMRVIANGGYVTETPFALTGATQANPAVLDIPGNNYVIGNWIFLAAVGGMTELDNETVVVTNVAGNLVTIADLFGNPVNSLAFDAYTSGGTAARIYTLTTPYHAVDLPYLKYTQSADVMSLACVNQATQVDYPPQDLTRLAANNWTIAPPTFASSIGPPTSCAASGTTYATGPGPAAYGYVVTAVDAVTGEESIASNIGVAGTVVDIAGQFGTVTVTWVAPSLIEAPNGVSSYNVYRATPDYTNTGNFINQLFGFVGSTTGALHWQDTNIIADFTTTPPQHTDPFSGGTGFFPGVVTYFQQRRVYGYQLQAPDAYEMSQPGAYTNFDAADPPIDSDSITGTPWGEQVNGIQWMLPMPGGLVTFTGKTTWQVSGTAGVGSPITPAQQSATAQEGIGTSATLPPLRIRYNIIFGESLSGYINEINYNFYFNIYTGQDITVLSSQLFQGFQITQWSWAYSPYRVIWGVRDDGKLLCLTYVQEQEVRGWTRHDTNGLFVSVAVASETPANAPYFIVKRFVRGQGKWAYMQERMDNRLWQNVEQSFCLDSALSLVQPAPNATLGASAAQGAGGVVLNYIVLGGSNYTAPAGYIVDDAGTGVGAAVTGFTVAGGVITGIAITPGMNYGLPRLVVTDDTGSGLVASLAVDNSVVFMASSAVFDGVSTGVVGQVIRMGGGIGTVSQYVSPTQVIAQLAPQAAITAIIPNDPYNTPVPQPAGSWTITTPVTEVSGLDHLEGMTVNALCDGTPVTSLVVSGGSVTLPNAASSIVIGLPFIAQAQSLHADLPSEMIQGDRKRIQGVVVRLANTRGILLGQDQPVAAQQRNQMELPWNVTPNFMTALVEPNALAGAGNAVPLFSGDKYVSIAGDYSTTDGQPSPGMVAVLQELPLPAEILAFMPQLELGDQPKA